MLESPCGGSQDSLRNWMLSFRLLSPLFRFVCFIIGKTLVSRLRLIVTVGGEGHRTGLKRGVCDYFKGQISASYLRVRSFGMQATLVRIRSNLVF